MTTTIPDMDQHLAEQIRLVTEALPLMVGIEASPVEGAPWPPDEPLLLGTIHFRGDWEGSMRIECTLPFAFAFTERFMAVPLPTSFDDDVKDSVGELANTIAGNFKALLPAGCLISLPSVRFQASPADAPADKGRLSQTVFQSATGFCCLVLNSAHPAAAQFAEDTAAE